MLQRYDSAGVTVDEFCRVEGISRSSFTRWRSVLSMATGRSSPPQPLRSGAADGSEAAHFVDLGALRSEAQATGRLHIRIDLGAGIVLQLTRG